HLPSQTPALQTPGTRVHPPHSSIWRSLEMRTFATKPTAISGNTSGPLARPAVLNRPATRAPQEIVLSSALPEREGVLGATRDGVIHVSRAASQLSKRGLD